MRIVSLDPFITDLVYSYGYGENLVGVSHRCDLHEAHEEVKRVTVAREQRAKHPQPDAILLAEQLAQDFVLIDVLRGLQPTHVLTSLPGSAKDLDKGSLLEELSRLCAVTLSFESFKPHTLNQVYQTYQDVGLALGAKTKGVDLAAKVKAQVMNWCDNFYDRMKNKKVTFVSSVQPLHLGGDWIPQLIQLASCHPQYVVPGEGDKSVQWEQIVEFRPDVLLVSPRGKSMAEALSYFKVMEKFPHWEDIPAVKRGEVAFTEGLSHFYRPSAKIIESMGILVSAVAGFESGYITERESFFRLRWLEMQRHRY